MSLSYSAFVTLRRALPGLGQQTIGAFRHRRQECNHGGCSSQSQHITKKRVIFLFRSEPSWPVAVRVHALVEETSWIDILGSVAWCWRSNRRRWSVRSAWIQTELLRRLVRISSSGLCEVLVDRCVGVLLRHCSYYEP